MQPYNCNEECDVIKEQDKCLSLIEKCDQKLNIINNRLNSILLSDSPKNQGQNTPNQSVLLERLQYLVEKIDNIKDRISL